MWCNSSHDENRPEASWNLYQHIERVEGLNLADTNMEAFGVFKPYDQRLDGKPFLESHADGELILKVWFRVPVSIRHLCVASCSAESGNAAPGARAVGAPPATVRCFTGPATEQLDFESIGEVAPAQVMELPVNPQADVSMQCALKPFTQVAFLLLHFDSNHGGAGPTRLSYLGLQGEHSHATRQAVEAKYELVHSGRREQASDERGASDESHDCL